MPDSLATSAVSARRGERTAAPNAMNLIVTPVGADSDLRSVLEDLKMGRYSAARDLLIRTGGNWSLYASRSQRLTDSAAGRGVLKMWRDEEPHSAHAATLWAWSLTRGAIDLHREGANTEVVGRAAAMAQQEWKKVDELWPHSPEPWSGRLQLSQLPYDARYFDPHWRNRQEPWNKLADPVMHHEGPWPLLGEVNRRHPGSRDGHHRMREYFLHRHGASVSSQYTHWLVAGGQLNPELLVLPLYSQMDLYRERHSDGRNSALQFWQTEQVRHFATRAYEGWFAHIPRTEYAWVSPWDLNHLAHALVGCGETERAAWVFRALGPYATPQPWKDVLESLGRSRDWTDEFLRIRTTVLGRGAPR
ncbi:hypothetical protein [Streptomyces sp. 2A115]|uniref:hypothetical protein n=1 Tax=Streptomyces sp. 2A115 TaxID=3457439 RepID=UPI003FD3E18A